MIETLLIANRGEIAVRIARTCRALGIATIAVHSDADTDAMHVATCDTAMRIGPAPATESYLRGDAIIAAALASGADAIHPGYGFLSENADFAAKVLAAGLVWVGPPPDAIRAMGLKDAAKTRMEAAGVPVVPGYHGTEQDPRFLAGCAAEIGYPVLIKARAGGGGKGMRRVDDAASFAEALEGARREAGTAFGDDRVLIEKYVATPRHIEVQVFADSHGNAVHLFERDCSLQRRHQKVIEEAPAPGMTPEMRAEMGAAAVRAAKAVDYVGAGTVEFIADASAGLRVDRFYFMEMNTRLQVEHPVTEAITGTDLVAWQLAVAAGDRLPRLQEDLQIDGCAVEARLYAEDAAQGFLPATGQLHHLLLPTDIRVDSGVREGDIVTRHYDPMVAKLIGHGPTRSVALARLTHALKRVEVAGCVTNAGFLRRLLSHEDVQAGAVDTGLIDREAATLCPEPPTEPTDWAAAALAISGLLDATTSPWSARDGWRAWGASLVTLDLVHGDEAGTIRLMGNATAWDVETPAGVASLKATTDPYGLKIESGGRRHRVAVVRRGTAVTVIRDGTARRFAPVDHDSVDGSAVGEDTVRAPMPGLVKAVHVAAGDMVEAGTRLVTLEAMKMEHTLRAPRDGILETVAVAAGDQVEEGALLAALSEA